MEREHNLRCPCCEKELKVTHQGWYQDIGERVTRPNAQPSLKDGYQCTYEFCVANNLEAVWIEDGSLFLSKIPSQLRYTVASKIIEKFSISGEEWALGSWNHYYHLGKKELKREK